MIIMSTGELLTHCCYTNPNLSCTQSPFVCYTSAICRRAMQSGEALQIDDDEDDDYEEEEEQ
jgi:hypothetical protein